MRVLYLNEQEERDMAATADLTLTDWRVRMTQLGFAIERTPPQTFTTVHVPKRWDVNPWHDEEEDGS